MDLATDVNYFIYLSHGVFPNGFNTYPTWVHGDKENNEPLFVPFKMENDYDGFVYTGARSLAFVASSTLLLLSTLYI